MEPDSLEPTTWPDLIQLNICRSVSFEWRRCNLFIKNVPISGNWPQVTSEAKVNEISGDQAATDSFDL